MEEIEIWKNIEGFDDYEVSSHARVRSLDRVAKNKVGVLNSRRKGKILKLVLDNKGYFKVGVFLNGKMYNKNIHVLVAKAFIPNTENKKQVNHIDGVKTNNSISNLEWVTPKENTHHAMKMNLRKCGEESPHSIITNKIANLIRIEYKLKEGTQKMLASKYGISRQLVSLIILNKSYI